MPLNNASFRPASGALSVWINTNHRPGLHAGQALPVFGQLMCPSGMEINFIDTDD